VKLIHFEKSRVELDFVFSIFTTESGNTLGAPVDSGLMVAQDMEMATDDGGFRHIYHNVRVYIKVQWKQISEAAAKTLIRTLVLRSEDHFKTLLKAGLSEYAQFIKEPEKVTRERETLKRRQQVLQEDLDVAGGFTGYAAASGGGGFGSTGSGFVYVSQPYGPAVFSIPRPRSLMTPGDGPQRPLAAKPSRGNGPHTCRRPAQPRVAAHPDRPRP